MKYTDFVVVTGNDDFNDGFGDDGGFGGLECDDLGVGYGSNGDGFCTGVIRDDFAPEYADPIGTHTNSFLPLSSLT